MDGSLLSLFLQAAVFWVAVFSASVFQVRAGTASSSSRLKFSRYHFRVLQNDK